jgi:hypothetical protein
VISTQEETLTTLIPVQALVTNVVTNTTGDICETSVGLRQRRDVETFEVQGRLKRAEYEVQQQCATQGDCFYECAEDVNDYWDYNQEHDIDCGGCSGISSKDLLGFDEDCTCKQTVQDPDEDIEKRIIQTVE